MNHQAHKLTELVSNAAQKKQAQTTVIAITSGKGGVGKTTLSANFGYLLAKKGYKVGLFDADIGLANLDVMLGVKPDKTILHLLRGECTIEDILVKIEENCFLIPGESGDEILRFSEQTLLDRFYDEVKKLDFLDYLVIDTGAGIGESVQLFLDAADEVVVVTVPDPAAITDAYAMIKVLSSKKERVFLLLNQVQNDRDGARVTANVQRIAAANMPSLKLISAGFMPRDADVSNSVRKRYLFAKEVANAKATMRLSEILDNLIGIVEHNMLPRKSESSFGEFFKRLLNQF